MTFARNRRKRRFFTTFARRARPFANRSPHVPRNLGWRSSGDRRSTKGVESRNRAIISLSAWRPPIKSATSVIVMRCRISSTLTVAPMIRWDQIEKRMFAESGALKGCLFRQSDAHGIRSLLASRALQNTATRSLRCQRRSPPPQRPSLSSRAGPGKRPPFRRRRQKNASAASSLSSPRIVGVKGRERNTCFLAER